MLFVDHWSPGCNTYGGYHPNRDSPSCYSGVLPDRKVEFRPHTARTRPDGASKRKSTRNSLLLSAARAAHLRPLRLQRTRPQGDEKCEGRKLHKMGALGFGLLAVYVSRGPASEVLRCYTAATLYFSERVCRGKKKQTQNRLGENSSRLCMITFKANR